MKTKGINRKILLPIIIFMAVLSAVALVRTQTTINKASKAYRQTIIEHDRDELKAMLEKSTPTDELAGDQMLHFKAEGYEFLVRRGGAVLARSDNFPEKFKVDDGLLMSSFSGGTYYGFLYHDDKRGIDIYLLRNFPELTFMGKELNANMSVFSLSVLLMILVVMIVLRRNLNEPIKNIMSRINRGECAAPTNTRELDDLVEVVNDALATSELKTIQANTLHRIAVSLNEDKTPDEIMDTILEQSRILIDSELSAFVLYDENGMFSKFKVYGVDESEVQSRIKRMPSGEGILKLLKLSKVPVRIKDVMGHHAFTGQLPEGHPEIRNFFGYPIFSREGKALGALYFANKHDGDFTEDDEGVLMAVASDAAVAIQKVQETEELERFKSIIESAFDVIMITDKEGDIIYVNPAFENVTGYNYKEVVGGNDNLLKSGIHDDGFYRDMWDVILSGKPWKGEFVNRKKNGELYNTSAIVFPLFSDNGEISNFVSIHRDISEEKKLYEQLLRAQKMEAIGTLAGGIAHDFNNILTAIMGYAELLGEKIQDNPDLLKAVNIIMNSAKKGTSFTGKILSVTRREKLELKVLNLNTVIEETLEMLQRSISKDIRIRLKLQGDLPDVKVDPVQIEQVIMNLAINARDAMPEGGTLMIETARVGKENGAANGLDSDNGFVRLTVSDTGRGISKEMQSKIFDPFFTTKEQGRGTGLGLYIVHSVVSNHGGYINLYTEPEKGTRFNIYLPVFEGKAEEEIPLTNEDLRGSGTVLVIDDEDVIRELAMDLLEPLGYNVLTACDGNEGIGIFRKKKKEVSVVILDMIMPGMNGSEVFQRLMNIDPEVKVLLCSGYSHEGMAGIRELLKSGVRGFIQKPFTKKTMAKALKDILQPRE